MLLIVSIVLFFSLININCIKEMPTITDYVPHVPQLLYPPNEAGDILTTAKLQWSDTPGAMFYTAEISEDSTFMRNTMFGINITSTSWRSNKLKNATVYFWRVSASNSSGASAYSPTYRFLTVPVDTVHVISDGSIK